MRCCCCLNPFSKPRRRTYFPHEFVDTVPLDPSYEDLLEGEEDDCYVSPAQAKSQQFVTEEEKELIKAGKFDELTHLQARKDAILNNQQLSPVQGDGSRVRARPLSSVLDDYQPPWVKQRIAKQQLTSSLLRSPSNANRLTLKQLAAAEAKIAELEEQRFSEQRKVMGNILEPTTLANQNSPDVLKDVISATKNSSSSSSDFQEAQLQIPAATNSVQSNDSKTFSMQFSSSSQTLPRHQPSHEHVSTISRDNENCAAMHEQIGRGAPLSPPDVTKLPLPLSIDDDNDDDDDWKNDFISATNSQSNSPPSQPITN